MNKPYRDGDIVELSRMLKRVNSLSALSRRTGLSTSTLRRLRDQTGRYPQNLTVEFVLKGFGMKRVMVQVDEGKVVKLNVRRRA